MDFLTLIEQGKFAEALALPSNFQTERSYCLYRLNKLGDALSSLPVEVTPASCHLKAQIYYRMERYEESADLYSALLSETYQTELETNCNATLAASISAGSPVTNDIFIQNDDSYELIFNHALVLTAQSRLTDALVLLSNLPDICTKELKESETDQSEIDKETSKIRLQIGVVCQLMNERENSVEIYDSIVTDSPILGAILANNRAVLNGPTRHIDSMLRLRVASVSTLDSKLLGHQKKVIACNNAILLSNMKRYGASTCAAKALDGDVSVLIQAGNSVRQNKGAAAYKKLREYFECNKASVGVCLALVQKYVGGGEIKEAIRVVEAYVEATGTRSGIVSLLVWLYHKNGDVVSASRDAESVESRKNLAKYLLRMGDFAGAVKTLEASAGIDESDVEGVALLVLAYSEVDPKQAENYARGLTSEIVSDEVFDVGMLESGIELMSTSVRHTAVKKVVKRHRKGKIPKNLEGKIDAERWVPKVERSYNQKRKKKGGDLRGPQGVNMVGGGIGGTGSARIREVERGVESPVVAASVSSSSKKTKKKKK